MAQLSDSIEVDPITAVTIKADEEIAAEVARRKCANQEEAQGHVRALVSLVDEVRGDDLGGVDFLWLCGLRRAMEDLRARLDYEIAKRLHKQTLPATKPLSLEDTRRAMTEGVTDALKLARTAEEDGLSVATIKCVDWDVLRSQVDEIDDRLSSLEAP